MKLPLDLEAHKVSIVNKIEVPRLITAFLQVITTNKEIMMNRSVILVYMVAAGIAGAFRASAGVFPLDNAHTEVGFSIKHMGISNVRGKFNEYTGKIMMQNGDPTTVEAEATIKAESIYTGNSKRDDHLRNPDFFHVAEYPEITFVSTGVVQSGDDLVLKGNLTMHGVTKEIELDMTLAGPIEDPWGNQRIGLALIGTVLRHDFGVGSDKASDKLIGKEVRLEINAEAIQQ
jgi:polyisoprenoid-binding protein YceI